MDFRLDDDQVALQRTVERLVEARFPLDGIAGREGAPVDRGAWAELADLGLFGLLRADSGLGLVEAALAFEVLGSHLVPGPMLWTAVAAPLVEGAADGTTVVGGVTAVDGPDVVEHAADLDLVLVLHDDHVAAHEVVAHEPLVPLDALTPVGRVELGPPEVVGDRVAATDLRRQGTVLSAAMAVGIAARALEVARTHALEREQFGVPIGSFQAVKHLLADRYVATTLAQSATYAAAAEPDDRSVAAAKLLATEAALDGAGTAVQVLGGMGFTWELLPNHLLKRAWVLAHAFGAGEDHAERLGAALVEG